MIDPRQILTVEEVRARYIPLDHKAAAMPPAPHKPRHGDDVEEWLISYRDTLDHHTEADVYDALTELIDDYRTCADAGEPLGVWEDDDQ